MESSERSTALPNDSTSCDDTAAHGSTSDTESAGKTHKEKGDVAVNSDTFLLSRYRYAYLFSILAFVTALSNGALPAIQTYSCAPYGLDTYLLASTMASIANPVAATLVMLLPSTRLPLVGLTAAAGTLVGAFCFMTAVLSPAPPLQHDIGGDVLIVSCHRFFNSENLGKKRQKIIPCSPKFLCWKILVPPLTKVRSLTAFTTEAYLAHGKRN